MVLYINSCVREDSRTDRLARLLLARFGSYTELDLAAAGLKPLSRETLAHRTALIGKHDFSDGMFDMAKQFASADRIVISAPYWDMSFPASLKTYIENIYVTDIVSRYGEDGSPVGLCKAEELYYVTTAGGRFVPDYSYGYIRDLAVNAFGIERTFLIKAEMLDIQGNDPDEILKRAAETYGLV